MNAVGSMQEPTATNEVSPLAATPRGLHPDLLVLPRQGVPIFHAPAGENHSRTKNWPVLASVDLHTIAAWAREYPNCAWIAVLGPPFVCIDLDGPAGVRWWERQQLANKRDMLETLRDGRDGRVGAHLFIRVPDDKYVPSRRLAEGVEVKSARTSAGIPPSRRSDGDQRHWADPTTPIAHATEWLLEQIVAPKRPPRLEPPRDFQPVAAGECSRYAGAAIARHSRRVAAAPEGARQSILNGSTFACAQLAGAGLVDPDIVEREFVAAAHRMADPLPASVITYTVARALRQGLGNPYYPTERA